MPSRGISHPQLCRSGVLLGMPLERKNRIVVAQKCLTACNQLVEPLRWGPHLAAVVLLEADCACPVSEPGLMMSVLGCVVRMVKEPLPQRCKFRLCHAQLHFAISNPAAQSRGEGSGIQTSGTSISPTSPPSNMEIV